MGEELVVLVDAQDHPMGTALKSEVHTANTPLHRAFSIFIFSSEGKLLVQQRAMSKKTWPGIWSNSCCGHPMPDESREEAIARRVPYELGITPEKVEKVSDYTYRFERDGIVEHEVCPVYIGYTSEEPKPNPAEVEAYDWLTWDEFTINLATEGNVWSEWCREEAELVAIKIQSQDSTSDF